MTWQAQHIQLTLTSNLHCGQLPLGFVARTYPFVPCHLPFFAMVPATVAALAMPDVRASYKKVLALFETCLRSTPLYILHENPLFPWISQSKHILERDYLSSQHGVTLDLQSRSAEDGKLFETEIILQHAKNNSAPTMLDGYIFFRPHKYEDVELLADAKLKYGKNITSLEEILAHMRLGGNGTRSLAKPCHVHIKKVHNTLWGMYNVDYTAQYPQITVEVEQAGPIPLLYSEKNQHIRGKISPFTGRIYGERGSGLEMDTANIAWREGWKSSTDVRISLSYARMGEIV